jgi:hypothetical protein
MSQVWQNLDVSRYFLCVDTSNFGQIFDIFLWTEGVVIPNR